MAEENIGNISTTEWNRLAKRLENSIECKDKSIGYVLIVTARGKEHEVYDQLIDNEHIEDLYMVLRAPIGLVAKVYGNSPSHVDEIVVEDIRSKPGVTDTETLYEAIL